MAAAKEHDLVMNRIVGQRAAEHRRRRMLRREIGPTTRRRVVLGCESAGEIDEGMHRRLEGDLVENEIEIGPRRAFFVVGGAAQDGTLAAAGDSGVRSWNVGER